MLSSKSDQEISWMLDDYGIKHGPVVGSTRFLYEKKLRDVMAKEKKVRGASERAIYREQQDVYTHQRRPWGHDAFSSWENTVFSPEDRGVDNGNESVVSPYYTVSQEKHTAVAQKRTQGPGSGQFVPLWMQIVFFLIIVGVVVFTFINMEPAQSEPFKRLT